MGVGVFRSLIMDDDALAGVLVTARLVPSENDSEKVVPCEEQTCRARGVADPGRPSPGDIEWHVLVGHVPFRPWCQQCLAARAPDDPRKRIQRRSLAVGAGDRHRDHAPIT